MFSYSIIWILLSLVLYNRSSDAVEGGQSADDAPHTRTGSALPGMSMGRGMGMGAGKGKGKTGMKQRKPSRLPYCDFETMSLSNLDGKWSLQSDGSFKFGMRTCRMRSFTGERAKKCLAGEHILFLGDSLSRYFYLALANLIVDDKLRQRFSLYQSFDYKTRSILTEKDFVLNEEDKKRPWSAFYEASSAELNKSPETIEVCDCFRDDKLPFYNDSGPHQQQSCFENRHFRYTKGGNLDDQVEDVRLSYIQWYGGLPMRGYKELSHLPRDSSVTSYLEKMSKKYCPAADLTDSVKNASASVESLIPYSAKCANYRRKNLNWDYPQFFDKEQCKGFPDDTSKCLQFEREVLGPMNITSMIANIGWHSPIWEPMEQGKIFLEKLVTTAKTLFSPRPKDSHLPSFMWRASNSPAPFHDKTDRIVANFAKYQNRRVMDFWDLWALTEPLNALQKALNVNDENAVRRAFSKYQMDVARRAKERSISLDIPNIMVDHAHYEPWVYFELNNIYLNAVCK